MRDVTQIQAQGEAATAGDEAATKDTYAGAESDGEQIGGSI